MRSISLTQGTAVMPNGQRAEVSTLDLINIALDFGGEQGLTVADFRARAKVDRALESVKADDKVLELDDKNYETLKNAVSAVKWVSRSGPVKSLMLELFPVVEDAVVVEERKLEAVK